MSKYQLVNKTDVKEEKRLRALSKRWTTAFHHVKEAREKYLELEQKSYATRKEQTAAFNEWEKALSDFQVINEELKRLRRKNRLRR
jgi:predicted nuclease with TOPRIM domain